MKNDLKRSKLTSSVVPLHVASWDGAALRNVDSGITVCKSKQFQQAVEDQLGIDEAANFNKSFVNYSLGFILCVNTPILLSKFYKRDAGTISVPDGVIDSATGEQRVDLSGFPTTIFALENVPKPGKDKSKALVRFCKVLMPSEFINRANSLSSDYKTGEKLAVRASYEMVKVNEKSIQKVVYRDVNASGRSRLKTNDAGGAGVWS